MERWIHWLLDFSCKRLIVQLQSLVNILLNEWDWKMNGIDWFTMYMYMYMYMGLSINTGASDEFNNFSPFQEQCHLMITNFINICSLFYHSYPKCTVPNQLDMKLDFTFLFFFFPSKLCLISSFLGEKVWHFTAPHIMHSSHLFTKQGYLIFSWKWYHHDVHWYLYNGLCELITTI